MNQISLVACIEKKTQVKTHSEQLQPHVQSAKTINNKINAWA